MQTQGHGRGGAAFGAVAGAAAVGLVAGLAANFGRKAVMQGVEAMAGDWFDVLKAEHLLVAELFEKLEQTDETETKKRALIFAKIKQGLSKHAFQEENVVYPALREADQEAAARHLNDEHFEIKTLLCEGERLQKDDSRFMSIMRRLKSVVEEHVREEEDVVYPAFRAKMSDEQDAALTARMLKEGLKLA
jgi:hemerythrin superfamily protein